MPRPRCVEALSSACVFDRFTDRAKKVMRLARQAAMRSRRGEIDAAHVLMGLLEEGSGVAAAVLRERGVERSALDATVENVLPHGTAPPAARTMPFTSDAQRLLALALEEADSFGHGYVGTEHLLLGALRVDGSATERALHACGVDRDALRAGVLEFLGQTDGERPPRAPLPYRTPVVRSLHGLEPLPGSAIVVIPPDEPFERLHEDVIAPALHAAGVVEICREPVAFASTDQVVNEDRLQDLILRLIRVELVVLVAAGGDVADAYVLGRCHGSLHDPIVLSATGPTRPAPFATLLRTALEYDPAALDAAASASLRERITAMARERRGAS